MDRVHGDFRRGKAVISHDASQRVERVCCPLVKLGAPHIRRVRVKDIFVACLLGIRFVKEGCGGWNRSDDKPSFCRVTVDALNKDWRTNGQTVVCRGGDKNTRAALVNFDAQNIQCFVVVPGEECRDIVDKLQILPSCCLQTILKIGVDEIHGVADAKFANRVYQTLYCRIVTLDESPDHCVHHILLRRFYLSLHNTNMSLQLRGQIKQTYKMGRFESGDETTPSIAFDASRNTGIFQANGVCVSHEGTRVMQIGDTVTVDTVLVGNGAGLSDIQASNVVGLTEALDTIEASTVSTNVVYGNAGDLVVGANLVPESNVTYNLGSETYRFKDLYLSGNTISLGTAVLKEQDGKLLCPTGFVGDGSSLTGVFVPISLSNVQITDSEWTVLDDTAISPDGGQFILNGSGFAPATLVKIAGTNASSTSYVSSTQLRVQVGARTPGTYDISVIRGDTQTATLPSSLNVSDVVTWITPSNLGNVEYAKGFDLTLQASSDSNVTYANTSPLPPQTTLLPNGQLSGNITSVVASTLYSFDILAIDEELQDSIGTFLLRLIVLMINATQTTDSGWTALTQTAVDSNVSAVYWTISGDGFTELTSILVDDTAPTSFSIVNDSLLRVQGPAKSAGTYNVTLTTPTATEVFANAVVYSDVPVWSTPNTISVAASSAYSLSLQATSDSIVMYSNVTPIPPGTVLDTSTGTLSGPGIAESTLYSFDIKATDEELQYTTRTFEVALLAGALNTVVSVDAMNEGAVALTDSGELYAWGPGFEVDLFYPLPTLSSSGSMVGSLAGKNVSSTACGQSYTMVIATDGTLHGFGLNQYGQLTGSNRVYRTPILINGGSLSGKNVSSVACGDNYTMVIATDGSLHGLGRNSQGQLGDGTTTIRLSPVLINGGSLSGKNVSSVACGYYHTMVIATDGSLHGFGYNVYGQLGDGTQYTTRLSPVLINGGSLSGKSVSSVACGESHTMVIATDGSLHGLGLNSQGQLGDGTTTNRLSPVLINGGSLSGKSVSSVACGRLHTMVTATDGSLHGVGYNGFANLGDGTYQSKLSPVLINGGSLSGKNVSSVTCGEYHNVVIATDGSLHGFGYNNYGQLGDGTTTPRTSPVLINGGSLSGKNVSSVACRAYHTMVTATDGSLHGFGSASSFQLGVQTQTIIFTNRGSLSGKNVSSVVCGANYTMVTATDGTLHGFGYNGQGQLGDGTTTTRTSPDLINGGSLSGKNVSSVACGYYHTMVIATDGSLHGFGYNNYGQLGDGTQYTTRLSPVLINGGSLSGKSVSSVACGESHTMVIATDGSLHGLGLNSQGQLGDGTTTNRLSPVLINGGSLSGKSVSSVACGQQHTMVTATDGSLHGVGYNGFANLGDGTYQSKLSPVLINGGSLSGKNVSSVTCGEYHNVVIATDGSLHGFGYNNYGQLGDGTTTPRTSPVLINGGSLSGKNVSSVACRAYHTMVTATDGSLHGFGSASSFQLGVQTQTIIFTNRGSLSGKNVSSVACAYYHTMVIATDG